jgi:urea transport system substrate-binding protein
LKLVNPPEHTCNVAFLKALTAAVALTTPVRAARVSRRKTSKVGILHSLSGTMAISETVLKDTVLMAIDEINAKGGVLGKKLEPVVVDPNWPLFAEKPSSCSARTRFPSSSAAGPV